MCMYQVYQAGKAIKWDDICFLLKAHGAASPQEAISAYLRSTDQLLSYERELIQLQQGTWNLYYI